MQIAVKGPRQLVQEQDRGSNPKTKTPGPKIKTKTVKILSWESRCLKSKTVASQQIQTLRQKQYNASTLINLQDL